MTPPVYLSVPKAAPLSGTLSYRIVISHEPTPPRDGQQLTPVRIVGSFLVSPIYRTHEQIHWLYARLMAQFGAPDRPQFVVPYFNDVLSHDSLDKSHYIERKRLQVERFLRRLSLRQGLVTSKSMLYFLSENMTTCDIITKPRRRFSSFSLFRPAARNSPMTSMRQYQLLEPLEGIEHEHFYEQQQYLIALASQLENASSSLFKVSQSCEGLGQCLAKLGDITLQTLHSRYRLGKTVDPVTLPYYKHYDKQLHAWAACLDRMSRGLFHQATTQVTTVADAWFEDGKACEMLRGVMWLRNDYLAKYAEALKNCDRALSVWEVKQQHKGTSSADSQESQQIAREASTTMTKYKQAFLATQDTFDQELEHQDTIRAQATAKDLRQLAQSQLATERMKLSTLVSTLHRFQRSWNTAPITTSDCRSSLDSTNSSYTNLSEYQCHTPGFERLGRDSGSTLIEEYHRTEWSSALKSFHVGGVPVSAPPSRPFSPLDKRERANSLTGVREHCPKGSDPLTAMLR
ncbi:hypothetical protein H4R34_004629 [Dimargaris verticillata]|uniref:PX domain-containing protein n=1 Tax=Dimargaris verticillata TaxID=2761393 RepID=A0A9W8EC11_9FUNG|nr:hypothetical protein H4R34_004629 [Dimargaris verticillata]